MLTDCCETAASSLIAIDCSQSKLLKDDLWSNIDMVNAICVKETLLFAYNRISRGCVREHKISHIRAHPHNGTQPQQPSLNT